MASQQQNPAPPPYQASGYNQGGYQGQYSQNPPTAYPQPYQGDTSKQPLLNSDSGYGRYGYTQTSSTTYIQQTTTPVVVVGGCPACRVGVLEDDYTCLGVCCAILCFPIGILCCLAMKQRRCPNCGAIFG